MISLRIYVCVLFTFGMIFVFDSMFTVFEMVVNYTRTA